MVFGARMVPLEAIGTTLPRDADGYYLGLMAKQFPGSWLPYGCEQLERAAAPSFRMVWKENGRSDYLETIRQWRRRFASPGLRKSLLKVSLLPRYLWDADFRLAFASGVSANTVCFERDLLDHYRLVFEKADAWPAPFSAPGSTRTAPPPRSPAP
jgi:cyclopropane-fatty-acyl-phospholipid synthase